VAASLAVEHSISKTVGTLCWDRKAARHSKKFKESVEMVGSDQLMYSEVFRGGKYLVILNVIAPLVGEEALSMTPTPP
jgi:hypothetical protein